MMFALLFMMGLLEGDVQWWIRDTGIYQPLQQDEVIVDDEGRVYVLNFAEAVIRQYDDRGELIGTFGRKGQGPGEFQYPMQMFLQEGQLAVVDIGNNAVSYFQLDGSFQRRVEMPKRGLALALTAHGWLAGEWNGPNQVAKPSLWIYDRNFENGRQIITLADVGQGAGLNVEMSDEGTLATYSPINSKPILRVAPDGNRAYLIEPKDLRVHVIDPAKAAVVRTFNHDSPSVPFDEDWADTRYAELQENMAPQDRGLRFKKLYPNEFPIVRSAHVNAQGHLVFDRWVGDPDNRHAPLVLTATGKEVEPLGDWSLLSRLVAQRDGFAIVTTFDAEDEQAGLAKIPLTRLKAFVAANPIVFDGVTGRRIEL